MTAPHDHGAEDVLQAVSAKQDRLEKRIANLQEVILSHFESLQQVVKALSSPSAAHFSLKEDLVSGEKHFPYEDATNREENAASQEGHKTRKSAKEKRQSRELCLVESTGSLSKSATTLTLMNATSDLTRKYSFDSNAYGSFWSDRPPPSWRAMSHDECKRVRKSNDMLERAGSCDSAMSSTSSVSQLASYSVATTMSFMKKASNGAKRTLVGTIDERDPFMVNLVRHPIFQCLCGSMVILNAILVGITVEIEANQNAHSDNLWEILSHACSIFFLIELIVRVTALGLKNFFVHTEDRMMNYFDTLLVFMSIVEIITSITKVANKSTFDMGQAFKTMRLMRILRLFRIFRFFHELSLMVAMILECLTSLFWAIVLLVIIMYSFAIIITQRASSYRARNLDNPSINLDNVETMFGTIPSTSYYLCQTMLGGVSWGIVADTILQFDMWSAALYFFYIAFTMLAVLNIITGIFVDNALETSRMQREYIVKREEKAKHKTVKELAKIFDEMDEDASGSITWDEMAVALDTPDTVRYFNALGLQCDDMRQLFDMIDDDCSGHIDLEEFLDACSRCTGDAKSIDVHAVMHDIKRVHKRLDIEGFAQTANATNTEVRNSGIAAANQTLSLSQQMADRIALLSGWLRALTVEFRQLRDFQRRIMEDRSCVRSPDEMLFAESDGCSPITVVVPSLPVLDSTPPQRR